MSDAPKPIALSYGTQPKGRCFAYYVAYVIASLVVAPIHFVVSFIVMYAINSFGTTDWYWTSMPWILVPYGYHWGDERTRLFLWSGSSVVALETTKPTC